MAISSLSSIGSTQQQQAIKNASAKLDAAFQSIVSGQNEGDVASLSVAAQLQSQTGSLKQIAGNIAQISSLTQVADGGTQEVENALRQLQTLAETAQSPTLNSSDRNSLNTQFQEITQSIDSIAQSTSFNGNSLLDGSLSGDNGLSLDSILNGSGNGGGSDLSISSLTSANLVGNNNILSVDNAGKSLSAINTALDQVTSTRANIGSFQQTLNFASASVDTAVANQQAAQSSLSDTDFAQASTALSLADVQHHASIALAAQGNKLSPVLLQLIS